MHYLNRYIISFSGLKEGRHEFDFCADDRFFGNFEGSEIKRAHLNVTVTLNRKPNFLELFFHLKGTVQIPCDRCLDDIEWPMDHTREILVKFSDQEVEEEESIVFLLRGETEINVAQHIYEFAHLALPLKRVHQNDENGKSLCNHDMLRKLASLTPSSENHPTENQWAGLKEWMRKNYS